MFSSLWQGVKGLFSKAPALSEAEGAYLSLVRPGGMDRFAKDFKLSTKARHDGQAEVPLSAAVDFGETESEVISHYERANEQLYRNTQASIEENNRHMETSNLSLNLNTLGQNQNNALAKLETLASSHVSDMKSDFRNYLNIERHFHDFRKKNHLGYRLPTPKNPIIQASKIIFILILAFIEIVLNGYFLGEGSFQGVVGGVTEAISYALINLVGTFFIWLLFIRNIVHVNIARKLFGFLSLLIWIGFIFALNLALAHFRELTVAQVPNANALALEQVLTNPFGLTQLNSWIVFAIGIVFASLTAIDAFYFVDPYPGFQKVFDQRQNARAQIDDAYVDALEEIEEEYDAQDQLLKNGLKAIENNNDHSLALIKKRKTLTDQFSKNQDILSRDLNALLSLYQQVNQTNRQTPAPAYFGKTYKLPRLSLGEHYHDETDTQAIKESTGQASQTLQNYVKELRTAYVNAKADIDQTHQGELKRIEEIENHET